MPSLIRCGVLVALFAVPACIAAPLDLAADGVLGKPGFTSPADNIATSTNITSPPRAAEDTISGALWVSDAGAHRILRFPSASAFANGQPADLVLGQPDFFAQSPNQGGPVNARTLDTPSGIAVDQAGNVYVSDTNNHRVVVYKPPFSNGMDAVIVIGQANFGNNLPNRGSSPAGNTLNAPMGLTLDAFGNLLVADYDNDRVIQFSPPLASGQFASRTYAMAGAGVAPTRRPIDVAVDSSANVWIVEEGNNRAIRFDTSSVILGPRADTVLCQADFAATAPATASDRCNSPTGIGLDRDGGVYLADRLNNRVLRFPSPQSGSAATAVVGQPGFSSGACNTGGISVSSLCQPVSLLLDRAGNLLVQDTGNGRLLRYDLPHPRVAPSVASLSPAALPQGFGGLTLTVNGAGFYSDSVVTFGGVEKPTTFVSRSRVTARIADSDVDGPGPFLVAVRNSSPGGGDSASRALATYVVTPFDGNADRVLGQASFTALGSGMDVGGATVAGINAAAVAGPDDVVIAADGRLFVSDFSGHRILSWASVKTFENAQAADIIIGQTNEFSIQCNRGGSVPSAATLCTPDGIAMDANGTLYVADRGNHRVLAYRPPFFNAMSASRVFGQGGVFTTGAANKGGTVSAQTLWVPRGVFIGNGTLFVHDGGNRRILGYTDPANQTTADFAIGQLNLDSVVEAAPSAQRFTAGARFAMDSVGRLYASFDAESRILRFTPPFASNMAADLVLGQPDFTTYGAGPPNARSLNTPFGLSIDGLDRLYVADSSNNRILRFGPTYSDGMSATAVLGQPDFITASSGRSSGKFLHPFGVAVHGAGDLVVADFENRRILHFASPLETQAGLFTLTVARTGANATAGTVTSTPAGIVCDSLAPGATCTHAFETGTTVTLTASQRSGTAFAGWSGDCTGASICSVTIDRARSVGAMFVPAQETLLLNPTDTLAFGPYTMGVASPPVAVTVVNVGTTEQTFLGLTLTPGVFTQSNACFKIPAGGNCLLHLTFAPPVEAGPLNAMHDYQGTLGLVAYGDTLALAATAEKSLVPHFYRSILQRAPEAGGHTFWNQEAARLAAQGANVSETWFLMASYFFNSPEYASYARSETQFVTNLYRTFFNREPDATGLNFWTSQIQGGLPREIVLSSFMFSSEFRAFAEGIFGNTQARPEVDMVMDFFRGILNRVPDSAAFNAFVGALRTAQCQGAGNVYTQMNDMSYFFLFTAPEYAGRARTNAQFVSDMYNAFLRRGATASEVAFWINQLNTGAKDRNRVRSDFIASPEFGARVNAIIAGGCLP